MLDGHVHGQTRRPRDRGKESTQGSKGSPSMLPRIEPRSVPPRVPRAKTTWTHDFICSSTGIRDISISLPTPKISHGSLLAAMHLPAFRHDS